MDQDKLKKLSEAVARVQAMNMVNNHILMELVSEAAVNSENPQKYLATMFENISGRADQFPIEDEAIPFIARYRQLLSTFFSVVAKNLPKGC